MQRRTFLRGGALALAALLGGGRWIGRGGMLGAAELVGPDAHGLLLPAGVTARVVARSGERPVPSADYLWHDAPDGGATFPTADGGWVYVSNSELPFGQGGVGALRFGPDGALRDAYPVLRGTTQNCAGGATPWGTWLSCEEIPAGRVWECDPLGRREAVARPALGVCKHEAATVDPERRRIYLTEDEGDGRLYRFTPATWPDLSAGTLEAAQVHGTPGPTDAAAADVTVSWLPVPDPAARSAPTRRQVPGSTAFRGGEGIWYRKGVVVFATKGDDRVWRLDVVADTLTVRYDRATATHPVLSGVDGVLVDDDGAIFVAEDGGDMQIVLLLPFGGPQPLVQVLGQPDSEITGLAFSPDGERFYFSSQRGPGNRSSDGITYELRGVAP